jgi:hypothetical protein
MGELQTALRDAFDTAPVFGSDWQSLPGSDRLRWLDHAHELGDLLERVRASEPIGLHTADILTPFPPEWRSSR